MNNWETVGAVAEVMKLTYQGALKKFKKLNNHFDGRLLRKLPGGNWEVCVQLLLELEKVEARDAKVQDIVKKTQDLEKKLLALRDAHGAFRRKTEKRLGKHDVALRHIRETNEAIRRSNNAIDEALSETG